MDAAVTLIGTRGLEETSMESIAAQAEVGTATIYNYFGSKNELLKALFVRYIEQEAEAGESVLQSPPDDMAAGMFGLLESYLDGMATRCSPGLLREFYVLGMSRQFAFGRDALALKRRLLDQCIRLAKHYKARGQVRDDVEAEEAAMMCYSAATFPLAMFALGLGLDVEGARKALRRNVSLSVTGLAPPLRPDTEARGNV